jgi:DNA-binding transcriptional ArsR family regulator
MPSATFPSTELQTLKAQFFKSLAHPIRIRILEILVRGEVKVQDLQKALDLDQPIVSQQLARLRSSGIVVTRKEGTTTFYAVSDPMLGDLLQVARTILNRQLVGVRSLLRELASEDREKGQGKREKGKGKSKEFFTARS